MLRKLTHRVCSEEKGFSFIELLVVILLIGILAAIALPTFLSQKTKGQDAAAKSNARNTMSQVESCFTDTETYASCTTDSGTQLQDGGIPTGSGHGQVSVSSSTATSFVVTAKSNTGTDFVITKATGEAPTRSCSSAGEGGCPGSGGGTGSW